MTTKFPSNSDIINAFYEGSTIKFSSIVLRQFACFTDSNLSTEVSVPYIGKTHILSYIVERRHKIRRALQLFEYLLNLEPNILIELSYQQKLFDKLCIDYDNQKFLEIYLASRYFDMNVLKTLSSNWKKLSQYSFNNEKILMLANAGYITNPTTIHKQKDDIELINKLNSIKSRTLDDAEKSIISNIIDKIEKSA